MWPFAPAYLTTPKLIEQIIAQLPSLERANALIDAYLINFSWLRCVIDRPQILSELIPMFYPRPSTESAHGTATTELVAVATEHPHELALLFALFSCGAIADLTQPPNNPEGAHYNALSRATLGLYSIFEEGSLSACQALYAIAAYDSHSGHEPSDAGWKLTSLAICIGCSVRFPSYSLGI